MNKQRLLKLAKHLESGKLGHKKFDYYVYNAGKYDKNGCGTIGCALGECPIIFKDWIFESSTSLPILKKKLFCEPLESAEEFFGLNWQEARFLFMPNHNNLPDNATRKQVVAHIRKFVRHGGIYS